jgi:hypothetical protein
VIDTIIKEVLDKLKDPTQLVFVAVVVCLFLIIRMLIQLLNRKEGILEGLVKELMAHGANVKEAVKLLELLVLKDRGK